MRFDEEHTVFCQRFQASTYGVLLMRSTRGKGRGKRAVERINENDFIDAF